MCQAINKATSAGSVQATPANSSGLTVTFDVGSGPTDTNTLTMDLKYFSTSNSSGVADSMTIAIGLTSEGHASRILADILDAEMNSETAASEQVDDDMMGNAGCFVQRMKTDI